jgi:GNAT superfamily N-acetyltransferase
MLTVVPANQASWDDLRAIFGTRGDPPGCSCQWFKVERAAWRAQPAEARADLLRAQTACGQPEAPATSGLVAYLDGDPAGWCAVEPRAAYPRLLRMRVPWAGRDEDRADPGVWALTCFVTRAGYRRRGISRALAAAAVGFARERGATALEGYPKRTEPGEAVAADALYVGSAAIFAAAGFVEVSRPTPARAVMRVDF